MSIATDIAEHEFLAWAKERYDTSAWSREDEVQTLVLMASEIKRHHQEMARLYRSLDVASLDRYFPVQRGTDEIERLDELLVPTALDILHAHNADLGDMLGGKMVRPEPVTVVPVALNPEAWR